MKAAGPTSRLFSGHYRSDCAQILSELIFCGLKLNLMDFITYLVLWRSATDLSDLRAFCWCRIPLLIYRRLSVQKHPRCGRLIFLLHKLATVSTLFWLHILPRLPKVDLDAAKLS